MTTAFTTGIQSADDGHSAGQEAATAALDGLDGDTADFVLVFSSATYDYDDVLVGVREVTGDAPLVGSSTAGEFTEEAVEEGSVVVSLIASDEMQFFTGMGHGLSEGLQDAVGEAADGIPNEVDDHPHMVGINLHDGLVGRGEEISMVAYQHLPIPFAGGSAGDDLALEETHVFVDDEVATDAIALAVIASKKPLQQSVEHGHTPISDTLTVTAAEGSVVHELNGRPAYEVWAEEVADTAQSEYGIDIHAVEAGDPEHQSLLTQFEFGIETTDDDFKVRWPGPTPDTSGPLHFATTIPEGTEMNVMHSPKDDQIASARSASETALDDADGVAGALVFDCACRAAILGDDFPQAVDAIADVLDVPIAGFETYGEVCLQEGEMRGYHNTTSSIVLIPE